MVCNLKTLQYKKQIFLYYILVRVYIMQLFSVENCWRNCNRKRNLYHATLVLSDGERILDKYYRNGWIIIGKPGQECYPWEVLFCLNTWRTETKSKKSASSYSSLLEITQYS